MATRGPSQPVLALALVMALAGVVFTLQGLGAPIGRSFMIGDPTWAVIGLGLVAGAAAIAWWRLRRR
jgi:hypothetical protein